MITHRVRQTVASSAPMLNARPLRCGQAPQPRSGAPKAQGLTAAIAVAAPSKVPSVAEHAPNSIGAMAPIGTSTTSPNYTSLTDATLGGTSRPGEPSFPLPAGSHLTLATRQRKLRDASPVRRQPTRASEHDQPSFHGSCLLPCSVAAALNSLRDKLGIYAPAA
jgi:hypothetical protein